MRKTIPSLWLAASCLLCAGVPAAAQALDLAAIQAGWSISIVSGNEWLDTGFTDEAGKYQSVYLRQTDINKIKAQKSGSDPAWGTVPLFHLKKTDPPKDAPAGSKVRYYQSTLSAYQGKLKYKGPRPATDYSDDDYPYDLWIIRPGTTLSVKPTVPGNDQREPSPDEDTLGALAQMVVSRPESIQPAPTTPYTALAAWPDYRACGHVDSYYFYVPKTNTSKWTAWDDDPITDDSPFKLLLRAFLPMEVELSRDEASQGTAGLNSLDENSADIQKYRGEVIKGNTGAPSLYAQTLRPTIRSAASKRKGESETASGASFSAFEYRFLACRMEQVYGSGGRARLQAGMYDAAYLPRWRGFVARELGRYLDDSKDLPGAKQIAGQPWTVTIPFDKALADLTTRTKQAIDGKALDDIYAPPPPPKPEAPKVNPSAAKKKLDKSVDDILGR